MDKKASRRWFCRSAAAVAGGALLAEHASGAAHDDPYPSWIAADTVAQPAYFAYVGSRTTKDRNARGEGINVYRVDAESGRWAHVQLVTGLPNPSYLALDRTRQFLYAVHGDLSDISAYAIEGRSGRLTLLNRASTAGRNPVHLTLDPTNHFVIVANHLSSTLVVLSRYADGRLGNVVDTVTLTGKIGPHRVEQPFPKPHQVEFDRAGRFLVVADKGLDRVFTFRLDPDSGKLAHAGGDAPYTREGAGPRHVAFHPSEVYAYGVNELDSTVTAYRYAPSTGNLAPFQVLSTLPDTFVTNSRAAEIAVSPNGRFVYVSNRGADNIGIYAVDPSNGRLSPQGWADALGRTPRFFALDPSGRLMFVANEDSDAIVTFRADGETGSLTPTGAMVKTGSPVCIVFRPATQSVAS